MVGWDRASESRSYSPRRLKLKRSWMEEGKLVFDWKIMCAAAWARRYAHRIDTVRIKLKETERKGLHSKGHSSASKYTDGYLKLGKGRGRDGRDG